MCATYCYIFVNPFTSCVTDRYLPQQYITMHTNTRTVLYNNTSKLKKLQIKRGDIGIAILSCSVIVLVALSFLIIIGVIQDKIIMILNYNENSTAQYMYKQAVIHTKLSNRLHVSNAVHFTT